MTVTVVEAAFADNALEKRRKAVSR